MADNPLAAWLNAGEAEQPRASSPTPAADRAEVAVASPLPADDAPGTGDARRRRWRGLAVLATVPWIVVTALALGGADPPPVPPAVGVPADGPSAPTQSADPSAALAPPVAVSPAGADAPSGPHATPGGTTAAAGVLAVRRALSGQSSQAGDGPSEVAVRYVDLALPEAVERVGDVAVVTVAAVVLDGVGGRWVSARGARYAVPIRVADGVALAAPWALPAPPGEVEAPHWRPVAGDDALRAAAREALTGAGYRDVTELRLGRDPALPGLLSAEVTAVAPGETDPRAHALWLRDEVAPAVLGWEAVTAGAAGGGRARR